MGNNVEGKYKRTKNKINGNLGVRENRWKFRRIEEKKKNLGEYESNIKEL